MKYLINVLFSIIIFLFAINGCNNDNTPTSPNNSVNWQDTLKVSLITNDLEDDLYVGQRVYYSYSIMPGDFSDSIIVDWKTSDTSIARRINEYGGFELVDLGKVSIKINVYDNKQNFITSDSVIIRCKWKKTCSVSGSISSITYDRQSNMILAGTHYGNGILMSETAGDSWNFANNGINLNGQTIIYDLDYCRSNPENIIALVGDNNGRYLYYSTNHGNFWEHNNINNMTFSVAMHPFHDHQLFSLSILSDLYVNKSDNLGATWVLLSTLNNPSGQIPKLFINQNNPEKMFIGGHGSFFSSDSGRTWSLIQWQHQGPDFQILFLDNAGNIYVRDYNWDGTIRMRIVKSGDDGATWSIVKVMEKGNFISTFTVYDRDINLLSFSTHDGGDIIISKDGGLTWSPIKTYFISTLYYANIILILNSNPLELIVTSASDIPYGGDGIWKYTEIN